MNNSKNQLQNQFGQGLIETLIIAPILMIGFSASALFMMNSYFRIENSFLTQELAACYKSQWLRGDCTRLYRKKLRSFPGHWRLKYVREYANKTNNNGVGASNGSISGSITVAISTRSRLIQNGNSNAQEKEIYKFTEEIPWRRTSWK